MFITIMDHEKCTITHLFSNSITECDDIGGVENILQKLGYNLFLVSYMITAAEPDETELLDADILLGSL